MIASHMDDRERVELHFKCKNLRDKDFIGLSDPVVRVYESANQSSKSSDFRFIGETETLKNNLNPDFDTPVTLDFIFETHQYLRIEVWDVDTAKGNDDDLIGFTQIELAQVMSRGKKGLHQELRNKGMKTGQLTVKFQKIGPETEQYMFKLCCRKVKNVEWFSKSDPFLRIYRPDKQFMNSDPMTIQDRNWTIVKETEFVKNNLNPDFSPFVLTGAKLCYNYYDCPVKVEIWDNSKRGHHSLISTGYIRVSQLIRRDIESFDTLDSGGRFGGTVVIQSFQAQKLYSLAELLSGGLQMSLYVAIDFTGSNGHPSDPQSLHFRNPSGQDNQYMAAIRAVGSILEMYDSDKQIPAYGYGAQVQALGNNYVSHCFPLTADLSNPYCQGVQGVFQAYQQILDKVNLSGPTIFSEVIKQATMAVNQGVQNGAFAYSTLLILTDGQITDMEDTIDAIVVASSAPLSIIIVGVGRDDFSSMEVLDGDGKRLKGNKGTAVRDIVQFVEFNRFGGNYQMLAAAVLKEIPKQVSSFFAMNGHLLKM